jgi:hypothetical protein
VLWARHRCPIHASRSRAREGLRGGFAQSEPDRRPTRLQATGHRGGSQPRCLAEVAVQLRAHLAHGVVLGQRRVWADGVLDTGRGTGFHGLPTEEGLGDCSEPALPRHFHAGHVPAGGWVGTLSASAALIYDCARDGPLGGVRWPQGMTHEAQVDRSHLPLRGSGLGARPNSFDPG